MFPSATRIFNFPEQSCADDDRPEVLSFGGLFMGPSCSHQPNAFSNNPEQSRADGDTPEIVSSRR
jgi:hypothetical protein